MTDVFKELPRLMWRGIEVPVLERSVSFEQEYARHKYAYRDNEYLESLGRKNWRFEYTIPFREDITKGPYRHLYIATFSEFLQACRDRSVGDLQDPVLGPYTARCESVSIRTDINRRDGEDVQVVFVDSPALDDIEATGSNASGQAGSVRQAVDFNTLTSPEILSPYANPEDFGKLSAITDGFDILDQITGNIAMAVSYVDRVDAAFASYESKIDKIIDVFDDINKRRLSPETMPFIRSCIRAKDAVQKLKSKSLKQSAPIFSDVTIVDMPVVVLANKYNIPLDDFLRINPKLPMPLVPSGTTVKYFQRGIL